MTPTPGPGPAPGAAPGPAPTPGAGRDRERTGNGTSTESSTDTGSGTSTRTKTGTGSGTGTGTGTGSRRRRKAAGPRRGPSPRTPLFRGVTLRMRLELPRGHTEQCGLRITARRHRIPGWSRDSDSDDDVIGGPRGRRRCTSCGTQRTPMWRTAEGGTLLCNACGIRYRKYGVRCQSCWNIPGKSGMSPRCRRCPQCPTRPPGEGGDNEDTTAAA